jgi:glycine/D-amino acid oxidase-like deaminating enzyme
MGDAPGFFRSGLNSVPNTENEQKRLREICYLLPDSLISETKRNHFHFPRAGWFSAKIFLEKLNLEKKLLNITKLRFDNRWEGYSDNAKVFSSQNLILATGANLELLPDHLEIKKIRGQAISVDTYDLRSVLNGDVTIFPTVQGKSVVSGTYQNSSILQISPEDTNLLLEQAETLLGKSLHIRSEWVGLRASARDRTPIVGQAPKWAALTKTQRVRDVKLFEPGLHYCLAFGSRGATHARLYSEHLVSKILGEPSALGKIEQAILSPARFFIRNQVRF